MIQKINNDKTMLKRREKEKKIIEKSSTEI